ncbi:glycosyl hydrolase family 18 protein [Photobacterium angustum]|uniref:chitinase n=1 Tax=Photobacterium angustum TaxID=661 RepID=A0A2S7VIS8_PHOAN|nr:glycosyl hydrolase family 18 protein [Photobacterium angustum]PQJ61865.1 hypothetical protein BTO08_16500 [Photobacterium angustum]
MKKKRLNKILIGMMITGCTAGSMASTIAYAEAEPWVSGVGLTKTKIDSTKEIYNTYEADKALPKVSAYLSNWAHYEQGYEPNIEALSKYDTVILSFFGLCGTEVGDPSITGAVEHLKTYCDEFGGKKFEIMTTDKFADFQKEFPSAGVPGKWDGKWLEKNPGGMLGVMQKLANDTDTKVAVSIFGWSLSNIASDAVKPENRPVLINSLIEFLNAYPFVSQLDIDWEYPGIQGASENVFDPENDAKNYADFIRDLRSALHNNGRDDVKIGIASGAPKDKIDAAELQNLITAGVDTIHLMTYDFFGESWADELAHHTNLMSNASREWSSDASIRYMIDELNIDPAKIQIGYANYSRNAIDAEITSHSPLQGTFVKGKNVMGSWEAASTSINDIFTHYANPDETKGLLPINDYHLYTDEEANADYLYKKENGIFLSIDTPRTVYAKAQYAVKNKLGGIFNWMGDPDEGLMLNAAREGLGNKIITQKINMDKIINTCGENTTAEKCEKLTLLIGNEVKVDAGESQQAEFALGQSYLLHGSVTHSDKVKKTVWTVKKVIGTDKANIIIDNKKKLETSFSVDLAEVPDKDIKVTLQLKAHLKDGSVVKDTVVYKLKKHQPDITPEINNIEYNAVYDMSLHTPLTFKADVSAPSGKGLDYSWNVLKNQYNIKFDDSSVNPAEITLNTLPNKPTYTFDVALTVTNVYGKTDSKTVQVSVSGDESANNAPTANFNVITTEPTVNTAVLIESDSSDELVNELKSDWNVTHNGEVVEVRHEGKDVSFVPTEEGEYIINLKVTDVFGKEDSTERTVTVIKPSIDVDYVYPDGFGNYQDGTVVKFDGQGIYQCFGDWAANCNVEAYLPGAANPDWVSQQWKKLD